MRKHSLENAQQPPSTIKQTKEGEGTTERAAEMDRGLQSH